MNDIKQVIVKMNKTNLKMILFMALILFVSCAPLQTTQEIKLIDTLENNSMPPAVSEKIKTAENVSVPAMPSSKPKLNVSESALSVVNLSLFASNVSIAKNTIAKKTVKGTVHTIEVIDVTEQEDGCLVNVDGIVDLVNVGETKSINGVKIFIADAYAIRSFGEDKDVCNMVVG